jgi:hypothetical protein
VADNLLTMLSRSFLPIAPAPLSEILRFLNRSSASIHIIINATPLDATLMRSSFVTLFNHSIHHKFPFVTFATTIDGDILPRVTDILEHRRSTVSAPSHLDDSWTYDTPRP